MVSNGKNRLRFASARIRSERDFISAYFKHSAANTSARLYVKIVASMDARKSNKDARKMQRRAQSALCNSGASVDCREFYALSDKI